MGSLIEELKRQEEAARAETDRLRARIEELQQDLARAEERASRLVIAREEVMRVLGEPTAAEPPDGRPAGEPRPASPIGAVTVLHPARQLRGSGKRVASTPVPGPGLPLPATRIRACAGRRLAALG